MREVSGAAILFDMDGVLVDSAAVVRRVWRRWCDLRGLDADAVLRTAHGRRTLDTLALVSPDLDPVAEFQWLESAELADSDGIEEIPGASALLSELREGQWAVVTSAGRQLATRRLEWAGLPNPSCLVPADEIESGKPSPEGYLRAARQLNAAPGRCIVFEDAPAGVEAAVAAGMTVVGLSTTHDASALEGTVATLPNLSSVAVRQTGADLVLSLDPHGGAF